MGTIGGGGSVRILDNEDVDISSIGNGKILEYNSTTEKMQFVTSGDSVTNLEVLGSITFEGSTADGNETTISVVDPTADRAINFPNAGGTVALLTSLSVAGGSGLTYNSSTGAFGTSSIPNAQLQNSTITLGSSSVALGSSLSSLAGISSFSCDQITTKDNGFRIQDLSLIHI